MVKPARFDAIARVVSRISTRRDAVRVLVGALLIDRGARRAKGDAAASIGRDLDDVSAAVSDPGTIRTRPDHRHPTQDPERWELTFDQSFDGTELNAEVWKTRFPWGRDRSSVGELQWYVRDDPEGPDFFHVGDGRLRIVADRCVLPKDRDREYCSGLISTHDSFSQEYGYFEIRARVPAGQGLWPACWLLPLDGSRPQEIDIFEILGHDTKTVHMNVHYANQDDDESALPRSFEGPDFSREYHTFAIEWSEERIVWYVDGVERHRVGKARAVPSGPFYVIVNLAVGGNWPGHPDETTQFPAHLDVSFVRAYRRR